MTFKTRPKAGFLNKNGFMIILLLRLFAAFC